MKCLNCRNYWNGSPCDCDYVEHSDTEIWCTFCGEEKVPCYDLHSIKLPDNEIDKEYVCICPLCGSLCCYRADADKFFKRYLKLLNNHLISKGLL